MKTKPISEYLKLTKKDIKKFDILDFVYDLDSLFFIDPILLEKTKIKEFKKSREKIDKYFDDIFLLLQQSNGNDVFLKKAKKLLITKENKQTSLGYSSLSNDGSAIGPKLAERLVTSAKKIIDAGNNSPRIFELLGLFEEDFGSDRISDLVTKIILEDIYSFNQNIVKECKIKEEYTIKIPLLENEFILPKDPFNNVPCLLLPKSILTDLPMALDFSHIEYVVSRNQELRNNLNSRIGASWKKTLKDKKSERKQIWDLIIQNQDDLTNLEKSYADKSTESGYDFREDIKGANIYYKEALREVSLNPIDEKLDKLKIFEIVEIILKKFKKSIEFDGGNRLLYTNNNKVRHESYSQALLFIVSDVYSDICNIDVNREVKIGRGIIDVKFSIGSKDKVIVETKLSKNDILKGYQNQLPLYMKSENTIYGYYVVIKVSCKDKKSEDSQDLKIRQLLTINDNDIKNKVKCPKIVIIDGRIKPPASKIKK